MNKKTKVIGIRLPLNIVAKIEKRIGEYPGEMTISGYCRMRLIYDITRDHKKHNGFREIHGKDTERCS